MPKVSVIVPVYRAQAYLDDCVTSVIGQSFWDYELILVDDGSPDGCPVMCDGWAEKDSRIKAVHKENGGVSSARNAGLDAAQGEFVMFLDSDDFLDSRFLETAVAEAEKDGLDMYLAGFLFWRSDTRFRTSCVHEVIASACDGLKEKEVCELLDKNYISSSCATLYRRSFVGERRFVNGCTFGEDLKFVFSLLDLPGKLKAVPEAFYYYRDNPESATKHFGEKKIEDVVATYMLLNEFAEKRHYHEFSQMVRKRWVTDYAYIQNIILGSSQPFAVQYRRLKLLLSQPKLRDTVLQLGSEQVKMVAANPGAFLVKRGLRGLGRRIAKKLRIAGDKQ